MSHPHHALDARAVDRAREAARILALRALGNAEAAEEAAQETVARLVEAVGDGRWRPETSLGAYARGIARHVIAETLRASRRVVHFPDGRPDVAAAGPDALDELVTEEEAGRVRAALAALDPGDRDLLRLSFYEGLPPREIARRLREPAARIRKRKSRALERLRDAFFGSAGHDQPATNKESTRQWMVAASRRSG